MRISRDKLNKLAHTVADTLAEIAEVDFLEDRNVPWVVVHHEDGFGIESVLVVTRGGSGRFGVIGFHVPR